MSDVEARLATLKANVESIRSRKSAVEGRAAALAEQIEKDAAALRAAGLPVDAGADAMRAAIAERRTQLEAALADAEAKAAAGKQILDSIEGVGIGV